MLVHTHTLRITARQQGRPRGRADRRGHHEAGEFSPLRGQPVDVGRPNLLRPETTQVTIALIIDEDEDEIRFGCLGDVCRE